MFIELSSVLILLCCNEQVKKIYIYTPLKAFICYESHKKRIFISGFHFQNLQQTFSDFKIIRAFLAIGDII